MNNNNNIFNLYSYFIALIKAVSLVLSNRKCLVSFIIKCMRIQHMSLYNMSLYNISL